MSATRRVLAAVLIALAGAAGADEIKPGSAFLSPQMHQQQEDEARNPGWLWVEQGEELFSRREGAAPSCISCHADPKQSLRGAAARYPQVDTDSGKLINLEGRIEQCRVGRQKQPAFGYESQDLLGLTAYVASLSKGMPLSVSAEGVAKPFYEAGKSFYERRQGQLNLACTQCHDGLVGQKLRGDTISHGVGTGYPVYRLEWNGLGSLHRRLRACSLGVRATQFDYGSDDYLALELYLAVRAKGLALEAPGLRR
ncbi:MULTISPECIES: sulfur oxidation c-type cytochrome SoxA [unclassified Bosea (in: a-proteobacteria)]|uniref:sulfur oxidation c-type cytochrome SoxA n=1 Tax=unclassified Bosea (in: a-proteobacteria) TaxID=2653178 RepID=UPI000F74D3D6|nr:MULTISPECIES: sulfur oxidation c-type cytochrome SoxA [unclassified Bosea (in: a-proteobacteria)]AZO80278.1 sulfur oxidation c-type cytochrome SoxA [Bosea sp. Tri-49]RXT23075.1 sulfur oxidation c-type cytochrome SoxA [Bosea sp. Tri-39]RXT38546.1 sulfur oxidation c-type cytochrome SoxA [Bosea sp. Tri-54]